MTPEPSCLQKVQNGVGQLIVSAYTSRLEIALLFELNRHPAPDWLMALSDVNDQIPIADLLQGSVFYPASGMDGSPVKYLAGFSHSFVYVDWAVSQDKLTRDLDTFKGYRICYSRSVAREELCFNSFQPIFPEHGADRDRWLDAQAERPRYALWAIYDRLPEFDEVHGPERFSLLFVGAEGVTAFQSLYYSNQRAPSVIALIKCDWNAYGNWTDFFHPEGIFFRSVMQNPYGTPDYLFCDFDDSVRMRLLPWGFAPWPNYSNLKHAVTFYSNVGLELWGRGRDLPPGVKDSLLRRFPYCER